ncbi:apolipoprotein N-acyltransferase [Corynebacterium sp.]|uniref:apolipoprotein N-acyltransferase n=1 Tax=Corynebacterium sp. TaxID=1720 RepID=UPI0037363E6D
MHLLLRLLAAAVSGFITYASYEPLGWWIAGVLGVGLLYAALAPWGHKVPLWAGALVAFVHSVVLYLLLLPWVGEFVGAAPYIALSIACALYALLTGAGGVWISRWRYGFLAFPFFYVAVEFLRSSMPFGGFSWLRLAWGQVNGPLVNLSVWGGPALVTLATVLVGAGLTGLYCRRTRVVAAAAVIAPLVLGLIAGVGVNRPGTTVGFADVAAVQGNVPRMGLDTQAQERAVLRNHARVTEELADSGAEPDLVFWPENSSDVNPLTNEEAGAIVDEAVQAIDAPVLVGTITGAEDGTYNTMQVFDPVTGPGEDHHKRFLVPFGEWMPYRDFFRNFSELVDYAGNFVPGDGNGVVDMGGLPVGVATCYEVAYDPAYRTAVLDGAQLLTTPTNNATFGFTNQTYQQLAMSRFRAIETDRAVVVAATSGTSAIVHPDGTVTQDTDLFEPDVLQETLPLRDSVTFAVRHGEKVELALIIIGLFLVLAAWWTNRRRSLRSE